MENTRRTWAEETENLSILNPKGHPIDRGQVTKLLGEIHSLDQSVIQLLANADARLSLKALPLTPLELNAARKTRELLISGSIYPYDDDSRVKDAERNYH